MRKKQKTCAACGKKKGADQFSDGVKFPKTTCRACFERNMASKAKKKKKKSEGTQY